jgi:hypothetical protein
VKLRFHGDSLRFRLTPADVARLVKEGIVAETTKFGPGSEFSYSLRTEANASTICAAVNSRGICVAIPSGMVHSWSQSDTVGLQHAQPVGGGETLEILIEKDFECLEGRSEPSEIFYPNPNKACLTSESTS